MKLTFQRFKKYSNYSDYSDYLSLSQTLWLIMYNAFLISCHFTFLISCRSSIKCFIRKTSTDFRKYEWQKYQSWTRSEKPEGSGLLWSFGSLCRHLETKSFRRIYKNPDLRDKKEHSQSKLEWFPLHWVRVKRIWQGTQVDVITGKFLFIVKILIYVGSKFTMMTVRQVLMERISW